MRRSLLLLLALLVAAATACSDDDGGSIFDEAPPATAEPVDAITLETAGGSWEVPGAVCLAEGGEEATVLAVAQEQAAEVRSLVGHLVSGWPTTTWQQFFDYDAYERDLNRAAVTALALAKVVGEQAALEDALLDYEASYGDPDAGWSPPNEISGRLDAWKAEADALGAAIAAHCAAG